LQAYFSNVVVKQVDVPTFSGHVGIMPNHVPLLGILKPGVINVYTEEGIKKFFGELFLFVGNVEGCFMHSVIRELCNWYTSF
jgi:F0F1-type ATP synthase epsilon subunit